MRLETTLRPSLGFRGEFMAKFLIAAFEIEEDNEREYNASGWIFFLANVNLWLPVNFRSILL